MGLIILDTGLTLNTHHSTATYANIINIAIMRTCRIGSCRGGEYMSQLMLVNNCDRYNGQYVAVKSFSERDVICYGLEPMEVLNKAKQTGVKEPVLIYIPEKGMVHVY
jgi:hypothetical protein